LARDGSDLDGWARLVRAYLVLGEHERARGAAADARRALAGDPDKLRRLDAALADLAPGGSVAGVEGRE
jgi:cytochrome c-type biogenesis protein CcmH